MSAWLSSFEVARLLHIGLRDVWRLVERKQLTPQETQHGYRFLWSDVDTYRHRGVS